MVQQMTREEEGSEGGREVGRGEGVGLEHR